MNTRIKILSIVLAIVVLWSCNNTKAPVTDIKGSPLIGSIDIWCDESLESIISQQEEVFELAYKNAKINMHYAPELVVKRMFYKDSIDVMIVSHGIDTTDLAIFRKRKLNPRQYRFGKSAIAFIGHPDRKIKEYSDKEILTMLTETKNGQTFVIESKESAIALELMSRSGQSQLGTNVYALKNKSEVFDWVKNNPQGIGIIDWSALSDEDEPTTRETLKKVSVIKISQDTLKSHGPYQENLNGLYPFTRDLYFVRRLGLTDVSLGFASFICEERGQKIMLKAGLLPEYQSERWIEFKGLTDVNVVK